jgi:hypothetical protein
MRVPRHERRMGHHHHRDPRCHLGRSLDHLRPAASFSAPRLTPAGHGPQRSRQASPNALICSRAPRGRLRAPFSSGAQVPYCRGHAAMRPGAPRALGELRLDTRLCDCSRAGRCGGSRQRPGRARGANAAGTRHSAAAHPPHPSRCHALCRTLKRNSEVSSPELQLLPQYRS